MAPENTAPYPTQADPQGVEPFTGVNEHVWLTTAPSGGRLSNTDHLQGLGVRLNIGLVVGSARAALIDPGPAVPEPETQLHDQLLEQVRVHAEGRELLVVNTHGHPDHMGANRYLRSYGVETIWAHRDAGVETATDLVGDSPVTIDLGGVELRLEHFGRGHTAGDIVAGVVSQDPAEQGVLFCGDLVREGDDPSFRDSYPEEWVRVLGRIWSMSGTYAQFIPGHGKPVDADFVASMRGRMQQGHNVSRQAIRDAVTDATKAIPILPYGPEGSRELITRLRGD